MSEYACSTYEDLVTNALRWKQDTFWMGFGGSATPWPDDDRPPQPAPGATDIEEPLIFVRPAIVTLCRPVTQAEYNALAADQRDMVGAQYYAFVADVDAYSQYARWVFLKGFLDPSAGNPTGSVRKTGLFTGLVPQAGYDNASSLLPEHVQDHGRLRWLDYDPKELVTSSNKLVRRIVREFR